MNYRRSWK